MWQPVKISSMAQMPRVRVWAESNRCRFDFNQFPGYVLKLHISHPEFDQVAPFGHGCQCHGSNFSNFRASYAPPRAWDRILIRAKILAWFGFRVGESRLFERTIDHIAGVPGSQGSNWVRLKTFEGVSKTIIANLLAETCPDLSQLIFQFVVDWGRFWFFFVGCFPRPWSWFLPVHDDDSTECQSTFRSIIWYDWSTDKSSVLHVASES